MCVRVCVRACVCVCLCVWVWAEADTRCAVPTHAQIRRHPSPPKDSRRRS
eukprot:NODE_2030_length_847_cov_116.587719_g1425_i0.p5 GENE.NODE_2030_length_847_cov_116.587719_g1425_i0~~NODE_2030_length_847_cov_116.587719_g1425_i0.p5  ORF type:complete len:50 (+),score=16.46 NODE_2030_length_847_cov_116.587719_g1425_i0:152-301(+)